MRKLAAAALVAGLAGCRGLDDLGRRPGGDGAHSLAIYSDISFNRSIVTANSKTKSPFGLDLVERNLSALRSHQPDIADILAACDLPDEINPATGRDGTPTLKVHSPSGWAWLGGSSMPRASAEEMFSNLSPGGGSVTLPAMLTGMEAIVIAERLAPQFAVFVVDEPVALKLPLLLRDYSDFLRSGRIVFLLSDDVAGRMRDFFTRHPGYVIPGHLLKAPQIPAAPLAALTRSLEEAAAEAMRVQGVFIQAQRAVCAASAVRPGAQIERIVLFGLDATKATQDKAAFIERGLTRLGITNKTCLPLRPESFHVAARVGTLAHHQAQAAIYLGIEDKHALDCFPAEVPLVFWLSEESGLVPNHPGRPFDVAVTESKPQEARILAAGWPAERVLVLEPSADDFEEVEKPPAATIEAMPLAVLSDLPDDRPETHGVNLPSQLELWRALQREVLRRAEQYEPAMDGDILQTAQNACGTVLSDQPLIEFYKRCLTEKIAPATVTRSIASWLVRNGFRPQIWGKGWAAMGRGEDLRRGELKLPAQWNEQMKSPGLVVVPWFSHSGVALAIHSIARGNAVLMRGGKGELQRDYPGLSHVGDYILWFRSAAELGSMLREIPRRADALAERARHAAQLIQIGHTIAARLRRLIEFLESIKNTEPAR